MRAPVLGILLLAAAPATAQTPPPTLPPGLTLGAPPTMAADVERRWAVREVDAKRFPDDDTPGPTFDTGDELIVLVDDGDRLRVRKGDDYGWIPASAVSDEPPAPELPSSSLLPPQGAPPLTPGGGPPPLLPPPGAGAGSD